VIDGSGAWDFTVTAQPTSPIAPGASATFKVKFAASAPGLRDASVNITNSATPSTAYHFAIQGVGLGTGGLLLGYNGGGATTDNIDDRWINGGRFQALRNMTLSELRAKVMELAGSFKCAVYADADGQSAQWLAGSDAVANPTTGWQTFPLTAPLEVSAGSWYWLVIWSDTVGARVFADAGGATRWGEYPFGDWPDPVSLTGGPGNVVYCLYAEGTPAGIQGPEMDVKGNDISIVDGATNVSGATGTDFGALTVGGTGEQTYTIYNVGQGNLVLSGSPKVAVAGPAAGDFTVTAQPDGTVPPGGSTAFTVRFVPTTVGTRKASLSIAHGDSPANPYDFAIQGAGLGGGAGVIGNDSEGAFSRDINDGQIHGNGFLATVSMRITELRAKVVLENTGIFKCAVYADTNGAAGSLLASSAELAEATNGWNSFPLDAPLDLAGGQYYWLLIWSGTMGARVQGDPIGQSYYGTYSYSGLGGQWPDPITLGPWSNAADVPYRTYCLYAEGAPLGTAPGAELDLRGNGKLIVSGDTTPSLLDGTDFDGVEVGDSFEQTFTIENPGNTALNLTGNPRVAITGPNAGDWVLSAPPAAAVAAGGSTTFKVRFAPTAPGLRLATLGIASNDGDENPYTVALQGASSYAGRETIFPDTKTGGDINFDGTDYALGMIFQSSVAGKVTHFRVYSLASESGEHIARLWRNSDNTVIAGPYTWVYGGVTGWITLDVPDVEIEADTQYTIAISTGTSAKRNYPNISRDLNNAGNNGRDLSYPANAGVFIENRNARPTSTYHGGNYLRDVVFTAGTEGGDVTYSFADMTFDYDYLPNTPGGVDFGTQWLGMNAFAGLTQCGVFAEAQEGASFTLPAGKVLKAIRLSSSTGGTWRISDGVNPARTNTFAAADTPVQVLTGWTLAATNVTVEFSAMNGAAIDDLVYGDPPPPVKITQIKPDAATGNVLIRWEGEGSVFQVEKAAAIKGPYQALGGWQTAREYTDAGALKKATQSFYRIRK
jgi:hypothetical protein